MPKLQKQEEMRSERMAKSYHAMTITKCVSCQTLIQEIGMNESPHLCKVCRDKFWKGIKRVRKINENNYFGIQNF